MNDILTSRFGGPGSPTNMQLGYFILRAMLGMNLFFHGFMRVLTGLGAFAGGRAESFVGTPLPMSLVQVALFAIPIVELVVGACLLLGLLTRWALLGGVLLFFFLMFGHVVRQNWEGAHLIMHYGVYYWVLLVFIGHNWLALDNRLAAKA